MRAVLRAVLLSPVEDLKLTEFLGRQKNLGKNLGTWRKNVQMPNKFLSSTLHNALQVFCLYQSEIKFNQTEVSSARLEEGQPRSTCKTPLPFADKIQPLSPFSRRKIHNSLSRGSLDLLSFEKDSHESRDTHSLSIKEKELCMVCSKFCGFMQVSTAGVPCMVCSPLHGCPHSRNLDTTWKSS